MLKAYKASVSFLEEHKAALGPDHRTVANSIRTEILHLSKLFRSEELPTCGGRQSITELIKYIRADGSGTFSSEVKGSLIEAAIARLSGDTGDDVISTAHGAQKSQTHLAGHNYHVNEEWELLMDPTRSLKQKMTVLSKVWLKWGLRFPSAPTFRSGLSLLVVCCKLDLSPTQAHEHMLEFTKEFRKLRSLYPGDATLKVFPVDPADFKSTHPEQIGDYVECRVDKAAIIELAHPKSIPCKTTNASLTPSKSSSSSSISKCGGSRESLLRGLLDMALGEGGFSLSPGTMCTPAPRRARRAAPLAIVDQEEQLAVGDVDLNLELTPEAVVPPQIASRESISDEVESLLLPAGHVEPCTAVVPVDSVAEQTANFIKNRKEKNAALKEKEKLASLKAACGHDQPIKRRVTGKSSPVSVYAGGAKKKQKKGNGKAKACGTKVTKGTSKAKAKAKAIEDVKPKAKAKATTTKTPPPTESKPALDMESTVYYGGGRLYAYPKRKLFRVWTRSGDKKDKGVTYGKDPTPAHLKKKWNEALKLIQDDPRSVDVD
jgi:hypothetical protein